MMTIPFKSTKLNSSWFNLPNRAVRIISIKSNLSPNLKRKIISIKNLQFIKRINIQLIKIEMLSNKRN